VEKYGELRVYIGLRGYVIGDCLGGCFLEGILVKPIGVVHTNVSEEAIKSSLQGVKGVIEVFEEFSEGLEGIEGFSHLFVIAFLNRVTEEQRKVLRVKFRRLVKFGFSLAELPEVGVFCSDSPHRPNPIALTIVRLIERRGRFLMVDELDLYDGTPVLDLKPYTPDRRVEDLKLPRWYTRIAGKVSEISGLKKPHI